MTDEEAQSIKPGETLVDVLDPARTFVVREVDLRDRLGRNFRGVVSGEEYSTDVRTLQAVWRRP